jgi:adenylate cyclase
MTKSLGCEAVVSDEVRATAGLSADALPAQDVAIRGRNAPMLVRVVADTRRLSALVGKAPVAAA